MMTNEQAAARVAKGAAFLDQSHPDWFTAIDVGRLDISHGCLCILGQVCGGYKEALKARGWKERSTLTLTFSPDAAALGFSLEPADVEDGPLFTDHYRPLQDAWIVAIADRKLRADAPSEQPILVAVRA